MTQKVEPLWGQQEGRALRDWRLAGSDSLERIAAEAGVSRVTVSSWERGESGGPRTGQLRALEAWRGGLLRCLGLVPGRKERRS